jgi:hypothetical protein
MNDIEMRFALVRDALSRGYSVEGAMEDAKAVVEFALTGELPQSRGPIIGWEVEGDELTLHYMDGSRTRHARSQTLNDHLFELRTRGVPA